MSSTNVVPVFCPYCGCGCRLLLQIAADGSIEKTLPDVSDPLSQGRPCVKGLMIHEMLDSNRLSTPMIRHTKDGKLEPCSWNDAYRFINEKLLRLATENCEEGKKCLRDRIYFIGSGESTNEANYLLSKLLRSHFGSANTDCCARLCHAATGVAFHDLFGIKAIPDHVMDDVQDADLFLFIGTDPFEDYPVFANRILAAKAKGAKLVAIDVASNTTVSQSDQVYKMTPNGVIALIANIVSRLVMENCLPKGAMSIHGAGEFIESCREVSRQNPPSTVGFTDDDMKTLCRNIAESKKMALGFGMGVTQHANGTQNVLVITGLSLLLGAILFPNRGKINVQGAGDVGADCAWKIDSDMSELEQKAYWDKEFEAHEGRRLTDALYDNEVKFIWVMPSDPAVSMPDLNKLHESFKQKFIVYQHHHESKMMEFADVVLPCAVLPEEYGSITNGERRVRSQFNGDWLKNIAHPKDIKSNVQILVEFAKEVGAKGFDFHSPEEVFDEMIKFASGYHLLDRKKTMSDKSQLAEKTPKQRVLKPFKYAPAHFIEDGEYPYNFTTARNKFHFCAGTGTRNSVTLAKMGGDPVLIVNPMDAQQLGIDTGSRVKVVSKVGEIEGVVQVDPAVEKRVVVAPFHFDKLLVNRLTPLILDPESGTPCYKEVAVNIVPIV